MIRRRRVQLLVLVFVISFANRSFCEDAPADAAELFVRDKVWVAHLRVAAEAWQSMEPKGGGPRFVSGRGAADAGYGQGWGC
jgi:hypothetical protein